MWFDLSLETDQLRLITVLGSLFRHFDTPKHVKLIKNFNFWFLKIKLAKILRFLFWFFTERPRNWSVSQSAIRQYQSLHFEWSTLLHFGFIDKNLERFSYQKKAFLEIRVDVQPALKPCFFTLLVLTLNFSSQVFS